MKYKFQKQGLRQSFVSYSRRLIIELRNYNTKQEMLTNCPRLPYAKKKLKLNQCILSIAAWSKSHPK